MGSGLCGVIAARDALKLDTRVVGVVSARAPAFALSYREDRVISHEVTTRIADGMACRTPMREAPEIARRGAVRGRKVAIVVSGGNVDSDMYSRVLTSAPAVTSS